MTTDHDSSQLDLEEVIEEKKEKKARRRRLKYGRACLHCDKKFTTTNKFIRLCHNCKETGKFKYAAQFGSFSSK